MKETLSLFPADKAHEGPDLTLVAIDHDPQMTDLNNKLDELLGRIQLAKKLDDIVPDLCAEICAAFGADRLTIYTVTDEGQALVSKVKTGLTTFKEIKLPINESSIAGFAAAHRKVINIADVYDDAELKTHAPALMFLKAVDKRTGYRTKQMLAAPILDRRNKGALLGVVQLINTPSGKPFTPACEQSAARLAEAVAGMLLSGRPRQQRDIPAKYEHLITANAISEENLELAMHQAKEQDRRIENVLMEEHGVSVTALGESLAKHYNVGYEPFKPDRIRSPDLLKNLKRDYVEASQWLPIEDSKDGLVILTTDPERILSSKAVANVFPKQKFIYTVCTPGEFRLTLDQFFGDAGVSNASIDELLSSLETESSDDNGGKVDELAAAADNELVRLVNKIIVEAHHQGASDIHIEPYPGKQKTEVRFRKDGSLRKYIDVPASYRSALIARIKIMADLDISEKRKPQDGKIKFRKFGPLDIELRVATLPSAGGMEDVVLRILAGGEPISIDKLGLSAHNLTALKELAVKPYGALFVCGPTGSGKTTTLHSVLRYINTPETKIWTAEDPVEITQRGLRQVQMNPKAGVTFATAMRAFLRADPDVIMVGEMRDQETAAIGIEASLTGHLVLSTLHTNSAPESIIRLLDLGMDPFNFSDALLGVLAQRLTKRLCVKCKSPYTASEQDLQRLLAEYAGELKHTSTWQADPDKAMRELQEIWKRDFANDKGEFTLYKAVGCETCDGTGYRGRAGLHELLVATDTIKKKIQEHARVAEILATALEEGMRTLRQDGIEKILQGVTDLIQVRAVCIK